MQDFRQLKVRWEARRIAVATYELVVSLPARERFGLRAQMERASVSIGANIAEGSVRHSARDFARFLEIAAGSASELEHLAITAADLGHLRPESVQPLIDDCARLRRMLYQLRRRVLEQ